MIKTTQKNDLFHNSKCFISKFVNCCQDYIMSEDGKVITCIIMNKRNDSKMLWNLIIGVHIMETFIIQWRGNSIIFFLNMRVRNRNFGQ